MKKMVLFFVVVLSLLQTQKTHAQVAAVFDAIAAEILERTGADQAIATAQMISETIQQGLTMVDQLHRLQQMAEDSLEHFKKLSDVENFDEFMKWNNRQLYMERQVENKFHSIGMTIGGKRYGLMEAMDIPGAVLNDLENTAAGDFTEAQRRRMYMKLGLSPTNYAYVRTWQGRIEDATRRMATMAEMIVEEGMATALEEMDDMAIVEKPDERIGATSQWQIMMRALFRQTDQLKTLNSQTAEANNLKAAEVMLEQEKRLPRPMTMGADYDKVNRNFDL
jgi:hypothetical protein